ncbi:hypothetical protein HKD37_03G006921 [Glycine soja]
MTKVNKEPLLGQIWVLKSQILIRRILHKCRKILGICWLWKEQCRMSSGCLLVDPNGQNLVLCECCFAWMLWKLGRIDGDPVLRETRIWATWEYVSSVGGGQQGMVGLCAHCGCGKTCCAPSPDRHLVPHVMEWYLEICRGGQETLGTSGGVLLPKTKLDQSRPNPGIVGQLENEVRKLRKPLIVMAAQLIRDRVEMECLEGAWETLEGNTRCRFRGTIRFTATSLVHPDEPARTLQRTVEWTAPWISFVYF